MSQPIVDVKELFSLAETNEAFEKLGMKRLVIRSSWTLSGKFPQQPFVVRGPIAEEIFSWPSEWLEDWNGGSCDAMQFVERHGGVNVVQQSGTEMVEGLPQVADSKAISFELPREKLNLQVFPGFQLTSTACIAARGDWATTAHIEWGGGESIAKLISGRKLWVIATTPSAAAHLRKYATYQQICDLLLGAGSQSSSAEPLDSFYSQLTYHIGEPGDIIVQPKFATHFVLTARADKDGKIIWDLVTGYEAIDLSVSDRATVLFDRFAVHMTRGDIEQELRLHGLDYLVRLLKVRDYRESIAKLPLRNRKPDRFMLRHRERDVTTHLKVLQMVGHDVLASFDSRSSRKPPAKKARLSNLKRSKPE